MKTLAAFALGLSVAAALPSHDANAQQASNSITVSIDTQKTMPPVSKYLYGMFTEHIRNTFYRAVWAEMLDDRKFYFPITSTPAPRGQQGAAARGAATQSWRPIGPDSAVTMDKQDAYSGDQSPRIALDSSTLHGIRQAGLELVAGKKYTGRIVARATAGSHLKVTLVWGAGPGDRQSVDIPAITAYKTFPLSFTAPAATQDAALEITGTGNGDFHIGAVSLMPADNIQGFRPDTIALLKQINMGFWRYGGNYTSNMIWYHTIGDPDKRPTDWDYAWGAAQPNDLGMDEFMTLCKLLNVDAYISVNAGLGDSHSAAEQVEYMNGSTSTRLGALRAKNGHPAPYNIKLWNIGNEPWGSWQIGRTDTHYYMLKHNEFAKAMRQADPSITLIASGRMLEEDGIRGEDRARHEGDLTPLYGTPADWTGMFLKETWGNFDGIAEHWYSHPGRRFDLDKARALPPDANNDDAYVKQDMDLLQSARYGANVVLDKAIEWQGYQRRFPAMKDRNIFLSIDEYSFSGMPGGTAAGGGRGGANLATDLAYGMIFNEMMRHSDFLTMAAHTTGASMLDIGRTSSTMNALGLIFKLYSNQFVGSTPVALSGNSPQPAPIVTTGDQPNATSGSPTYPLDMFAAISPDHKSLLLSVVNATNSPQTFSMDGVSAGAGKLRQITGPDISASDRLGQPPQVEIKESSAASSKSFTVAPISVNVYSFPLGR
ncbi:MAG TPA: alpha-N-arabinofuranosidase [Acidisoma sp.]|jgi:alpha-N-arabinofuranosidase|nr:alpha-N-arabinofuranosidase [Acidisoma sp.]